MALESVTHISDLVATNPTSTDPKSEGDNHLRNIKTALKTDFPNISGPVTKTHTQLNNALDKTGDTMTGPLAQAAGTAALPSYTFSGDTNTGMWSPGADILAWSTGGSERVRIDASGSLVIGSTANNNTRRIFFNSNSGGTSAIESITAGATDQALVFKTTYTTESEKLRITGVGDVLVTGSGGIGYGTGSGGTVTQTTSRTTGVTLNKPTGSITLVSAIGSTSWQSFTLTNSTIAISDCVLVNQRSGNDLYEIEVTNVAAGSCRISFRTTGGLTVEQPVFNFAVVKGATS